MHRFPAEAPRVLAAHRQTYDRLVEIVQRYAVDGDVERVLRSATLAAAYGWWAPMGMLADPLLERLVIDAVRDGQPPVVDRARSTGRVLHVLSEAYAVGGHTRLARRWMSRDGGRTSDVALTNQSVALPAELTDVVHTSGGRVHHLRSDSPDLLARAVALRALFDDVDVVVLHVHPYDAVALAAVHLPGPRPPVIVENHADHAFWLGVGAADLVCDFRATQLSTGLRGIEPERLAVLPLPIDPPLVHGVAAELRGRLGIDPDAVVAVCVASDAKVAPSWGRGMAALVDRALGWAPRLTVVMVGVPAAGEWARVAARHPGRLLAVGGVPDPDPWYELADIYLESYPSRAGTSVLEAAVAGTPVLTLEDLPATEPAHIFQADSPGLVGLPRVGRPEQYVTALRRLVDDADLRDREGARARAAVQAVHAGPEWDAALERVYRQARSTTAASVEGRRRVRDDGYGAMLLAFMHTHRPLSPLAVDAVAAPLGDRYDEALQLDVFAALNRDAEAPLTVRVAGGWERADDWISDLLVLAEQQPRLAVSLPFVPGDDRAGSETTAILVRILASIGQTPENCGTIAVESAVPTDARLALPGELPCTTQALERLALLLRSPLWTPPQPIHDVDPGPGTGRPVETVAALDSSCTEAAVRSSVPS
ncbi:hypothetical protein DQ239_12890 [Blastococcus sp. TF02-09]|uniref:hypothetical protein n=1 Tax=Blastococcus sp. TF02-09 TaxID=2250576 RepID=UPI000DE96EFA|nr:hypothetical protein [Blastococcus sp. TF02-9]RBY77051.1 hypothetical protein DQ239_12890 [Blastococcus sp. TF02-9]